MLWFFRRVIETHNIEPLLLPSATNGAFFEAEFSAHYRPGLAEHADRDSVARSWITETARGISRDWEADEPASAQDAINAILGTPHDCPDGFYRNLVCHIKIDVKESSRKTAVQMRADRARIERLKFLKELLYTDPNLMMIQYLERHLDTTIDTSKIIEFRRLADNLRDRERWWSPLMVAWNDLADRTESPNDAAVAMGILLEAIRKFDARLARQHGLPDTPKPET